MSGLLNFQGTASSLTIAGLFALSAALSRFSGSTPPQGGAEPIRISIQGPAGSKPYTVEATAHETLGELIDRLDLPCGVDLKEMKRSRARLFDGQRVELFWKAYRE